MAKTREEVKEQNRNRQVNRRKRLRKGEQSKLNEYRQQDRERKVAERRALKVEGLTKPQARALTKKAVSSE